MPDSLVDRWWPFVLAPGFLVFVAFLPGPHPFTNDGYIERSLFALTFCALVWLAVRPSLRARAVAIVVLGAATLTRAAAFLFGLHGRIHLSDGQRIVGAFAWTGLFLSISLLTIVTQYHDTERT